MSNNSAIGRVESVTNEICIASGLEGVALNNIVEFSSGGQGVVLGFSELHAQIVILGDYHKIKKGDLVRIVNRSLELTVSEKLLGRVIDPLGKPLDGLGEITEGDKRYIESEAKPVNHRSFITKSLNTGYLIIDSQIPIGLGQRELIVGEKKVGKIDAAIEIIGNQTKINSGIISIYVAIDSETSATKRRIRRLKESGALKNSIVVVARTSESASLNYFAPMAGVTIAEWFASKKQDVLIVFDNLTRHAKVYRQLSLLLNRPAGREAYPGDIFYVHAKLLERCGSFGPAAGGGTITALPLVETLSEEVTDYITTNLMSITDGHILFKQSLQNEGIQPAIDSGFSVSRIGGRAQSPLLREMSDILKQIIIQYHEVERYMVFGGDLRKETLETIDLGKRSYAMFYQGTGEVYAPVQETALIYLIISKTALEWEEDQMQDVKRQFLEFLAQPQYEQLATEAYLAESLERAKPIYEEIVNDYKRSPKSIKPKEKPQQSAAETETVIDLLRGDSGEAYGETRNPQE